MGGEGESDCVLMNVVSLHLAVSSHVVSAHASLLPNVYVVL